MKKLEAKTPGQKAYLQAIKNNKITFCIGPPGTGKTCIASRFAVTELLNNVYSRIIITRPLLQAGEVMGYLPGTLEQKMDPLVRPVYDELRQYIDCKQLKIYMEEGIIEIAPFAYMQGRSFHNSFIIADECITVNAKIKIAEYKKPVKLAKIINMYKTGKPVNVLSFDGSKCVYNKVINVFSNGVKDTIKIKLVGVNKNPIICTKNHPFAIYTSNGIEYINAEELKENDILLRVSNKNNNRLVNINILDIISGLILGDASLLRNKQKTVGFTLSKTHSLKQYTYMKHCLEIIKGVERHGLRSGYTGKPMCGMASKTIVLPNDFIKAFYTNGKKCITYDIEKYITPRSLAYWYMDDGSIGTNYCILHTEGFSYDECVILKEILKRKFNISANINKSKNKYYMLTITSDRHLFYDLINSYIHTDMQYKLPEQYRHNNTEVLTEPYMSGVCGIQVQSVSIGNKEEVFNIEVENTHNFFVDGILTHNCENATHDQLKLLLTRFGRQSKMVINGDPQQSYLPRHQRGALEQYASNLCDVNDVTTVYLQNEDIIREPIIAEIMDVIDRIENPPEKHNP